MGIATACVKSHEAGDLGVALGPQQIADEDHRPRRGDAHHLSEDSPRFGDVMHDAVRHDRGKRHVIIRKSFGIDEIDRDAVGEAGGVNVRASESDHLGRRIHADDGDRGMPAANFDGNLGRTRADVERLSGARIASCARVS